MVIIRPKKEVNAHPQSETFPSCNVRANYLCKMIRVSDRGGQEGIQSNNSIINIPQPSKSV